jgi:predicted HTH transcriptional regulator
MFFTADQIRRINEQELVEFLNRRISESTGVIDYKLELSGGKGQERANAELLKDVSAFANAEGGHLLIGMNEPTRENDGAAFLVGIEAGEQVATQIEQRCAECIDPRIPGLLARSIPLKNGKSAIVVHIPPSPPRPHMVIYEGTKTRTYFIRHSETAQPMKRSEVRQAVLSAAAGNQNAIEEVMQL